jgi:hypothetical protein
MKIRQVCFLQSGYNFQINLSANEMLEISQEISRNFTPCFSSEVSEPAEIIKLTPRELLDIGEEIGRDFAPKPSNSTPELVLLPVDPGHLHAYWNLGENRETSASGNNPLTLRIYSQPDEQGTDTKTVSWFDVVIDSSMTHQQVSLPGPVDDTDYSAAIGQCGADHSFIEYAHSNIIHAPHGGAARYQDAVYCSNKNASGLGISK